MAGDKPKLGYIGMGLMGLPMTKRLLAAGYEVAVWNRSPEKLAPAIDAGAVAAESPAAVATESDIVFACLTAASAVEAVVFGDGGIASVEGAGKLFVDHSSMHPEATREFAARLEAANGMHWMDAPVSGGTLGAEEGTLAIMAGGAEADFALAAPVVAHTAGRFTLMGPVGSGQLAKLCNQMISGSAFVVIAEALRFASNSGIDAGKLFGALKGGWADSLPFQIMGPRMLQDIKEPIGYTEVILKDVETALEIGAGVNAPMPMTAAATQIYRLMVAQGHGRSEPTILYHLYGEQPAGS